MKFYRQVYARMIGIVCAVYVNCVCTLHARAAMPGDVFSPIQLIMVHELASAWRVCCAAMLSMTIGILDVHTSCYTLARFGVLMEKKHFLC